MVFEEEFHGFELVFDDGSVLRVKVFGPWSVEFKEG